MASWDGTKRIGLFGNATHCDRDPREEATYCMNKRGRGARAAIGVLVNRRLGGHALKCIYLSKKLGEIHAGGKGEQQAEFTQPLSYKMALLSSFWMSKRAEASEAQIVKNMYAMPHPTVNTHPPMDGGRTRLGARGRSRTRDVGIARINKI